MSKFESDYKKLLKSVLTNGTQVKNRTGVNAITSFGKELTIDLRLGFPIVTGKKIFFDKAYHEYRWIREGCSTIKYLNKHGITWWDSYADQAGSLGKTYGYQLRSFNGEKDQLEFAINEIRNKSRRAHITMWNPSELQETALPCCYTGMTFVRIGDELNLSIDFRSSDIFVGLPYDIIFGALLLTEVAEHCELKPCMLKMNLNNAHLYVNNIIPMKTYLEESMYKLPEYNSKLNELIGYVYGSYIEAILNV